MKTWIKALLGVMLSFIFLCTCIGYAAITDTLRISGTANAEPPQGIFITSVENTAASYGESVAATHIDLTTNVDTTVNIKYYGNSWNRKYGTVLIIECGGASSFPFVHFPVSRISGIV